MTAFATMPYRPSSGAEGEAFQQRFCDRCAQQRCDILGNALFYGLLDDQYPPEWVSDIDGPRCTAFMAAREVDFAPGLIADERQMGMGL